MVGAVVGADVYNQTAIMQTVKTLAEAPMVVFLYGGGINMMNYQLIDDTWLVSYTDSFGKNLTFRHPTVLDKSNSPVIQVDEPFIREIFSSDQVTEQIINYMKAHDIIFDNGLGP